MARVRCITEMGMGVDLHGRDATKAAKRAVSDAIRHSSLGFTRFVGKTAHDMFVDALRMRNRYGLLSEDVHPVTGKLWGNFPQTYSMSGLILTAIKLSRSWGDRYWRGSS